MKNKIISNARIVAESKPISPNGEYGGQKPIKLSTCCHSLVYTNNPPYTCIKCKGRCDIISAVEAIEEGADGIITEKDFEQIFQQLGTGDWKKLAVKKAFELAQEYHKQQSTFSLEDVEKILYARAKHLFSSDIDGIKPMEHKRWLKLHLQSLKLSSRETHFEKAMTLTKDKIRFK